MSNIPELLDVKHAKIQKTRENQKKTAKQNLKKNNIPEVLDIKNAKRKKRKQKNRKKTIFHNSWL